MVIGTTKHEHRVISERGPYGFSHSVAVSPITEENRAAHGGVMFIQACRCGYERKVNVNQLHKEYGLWGPSAEMIEQQAQEERERREREARGRKARALLGRAHEVLPRGRVVAVAEGIEMALSDDVGAEELLHDDTVVELVLRDSYPQRCGRASLGELRLAGRQWAGGPADDVRTTIYPAVAAELP